MRLTEKLKGICSRIKRVFNNIGYKRALEIGKHRGYTEAYVFFEPGRLAWIHYLLKTGYSHCGIIYKTPDCIIQVNFLVNLLEIAQAKDCDLPTQIERLKERGYKVVKGNIRRDKIVMNFFPFSLAPHNCVSVTKQALGIKPAMVWTPWQLYKSLTKKYGYKEV